MGSRPAFSHTISLSTSGTVNVDVSTAGHGANVGVDNLVVESTCPLGYTLSISGPSDSALYKNGDSTSSNKISPSSGTINNPLPIIGNDYLGTWGYSMTNNLATGAFTGLTSAVTPIFTRTSASADGGDQIPVYYGVSVNPTTEAGLYKMADDNNQPGSIIYYLVPNPNCNQYRIKYHGNGASPTTSMGITHVLANEPGSTVTLAASNYQKPGYGFAGWSLTQTDSDANSVSALGALAARGYLYGPNQTLVNTGGIDPKLLENVVIENGEQVIYLYATWVKPEDGATLQNWTGCNLLSIGSVIALTDTRNNDTYAVAKLADGKCWMIENLRLADGNSVYTTTPVANAENINSDLYGYGYYYSWRQASSGAVCPTGWHLPAGGDDDNTANSEFRQLAVATTGVEPNYIFQTNQTIYYNVGDETQGTDASRAMRSYPLNFIYAGFAYETINFRGTRGLYWSSTSSGASLSEAYGMYLMDSFVRPGNFYYDSNIGFSVRCVSSDYYTLAFNANGANGTMSSRTVFMDSAITLPLSSFSPEHGKTFTGWNTAPDGSGTAYPANSSVINLTNTPGETVTLYAQWQCMRNRVCYDKNGDLHSNSTMNSQAITSSDTSITLWASNYRRQGYGFAGWNTAPDGSGTSYGPNETIAITAGQYNQSGLQLYAMWVGPTTLSMQAWSRSRCLSMAIGDIIALRDTRDNETYAIARHTGGYCWMIENLRYKMSGISGAMSSPSQNVFGYGGYYTYGESTQACPTGWKVPTRDSAPSFFQLHSAFVADGAVGSELSNKWRSYPINFVFSGQDSSENSERGSVGYYWSRTSQTATRSYTLLINHTTASTTNIMLTNSKLAVRCVEAT